MEVARLETDVVIFGGGCAGLWLLDDLRRRGIRVLLLEANRLGDGQTVCAQGILHGGLKYSLAGKFTASAKMVADMPAAWRAAMSGETEPDLRAMKMRAPWCYLWRTQSFWSQFGLFGALQGLKVKPEPIAADQWPAPLKQCPGQVYRVDEPVIDVISFLDVLRRRNERLVWKYDAVDAEFEGGDRRVDAVSLRHPTTGKRLSIDMKYVVLTAGEQNMALRSKLGLAADVAQIRPLHVVLLRGNLPQLNGHCVEGTKTRVTITTDVDRAGRTVWQLGGQLTEDGVAMESRALIRHAVAELAAVLPGWMPSDVEWASYRVNRAERATSAGSMPGDVQIIQDANRFTTWPTKLVMAPLLSDRMTKLLALPNHPGDTSWQTVCSAYNWPAAEVALPPWEWDLTWSRDV
jgi:glycerol-3-phosphate dehydrogenase